MAVKITPITPDVVQEKFLEEIPDFIISTVNSLIIKNWNQTEKCAKIKQEEILEKVLQLGNISSEEIFKKHWFDFEDIYRNVGWIVEYDKPLYYETYPATFTFKKKE